MVEALQRHTRELEGAEEALGALEQQVARKKEVSHRVKELRAQVEALENEALHLQAER